MLEAPSIDFYSEKEMQSEFVKRLKNNGWNPIREEVWDTTHKNRVDIFAYHYAFDNWFCFELKNNPTTVDYTKALRQMIRYRESIFKYPTEISCLIVPTFKHYNYNYEAWIERFFWRWGFGVGDLASMKVHFVNAETIAILDLLNPIKPYFTPKEQIIELKKRINKYWSFEDANTND